MRLEAELERVACSCSNIDYRGLMRRAAAELGRAVRAFMQEQTRDNMMILQGAWANAERILKNVPSEAPPAPLSGSPEPARLAA